MAITENGVSIRVKDSRTGLSKVYSFSNETIAEGLAQLKTSEDQEYTHLAHQVSEYVRFTLDLGDTYIVPVLLLVRQGVLSFGEDGSLPWFYISLDEKDLW